MKHGFVFRYFHFHSPAKVRLTVDSESDCEKLVDAFAGFLLACGFSRSSIRNNFEAWVEENKIVVNGEKIE